MNDNLLKPIDDGLPMRDCSDFTRAKLRIIESYKG